MLSFSNFDTYQLEAYQRILEAPAIGSFLGLGGGKTITSLMAFNTSICLGEISKVLVIAPRTVANTVWHNEVKNWEETKDLTFSIITGTPKQKEKAVNKDCDFYCISVDSLAWLIKKYYNDFKWDGLIIDESTKFKNPSSKRFELLKMVLPNFKKRLILTGTPNPNGYLDLWSQIYILDGGKRLGKNITAYKRRFFEVDYMGYSWTLKEGKEQVIQALIKDLVINISLNIELPTLNLIPLKYELPKTILKSYNAFKKKGFLNYAELSLLHRIENTKDKKALKVLNESLDLIRMQEIENIPLKSLLTPDNAGVLNNKLLQYSSGAILHDEIGEDGKLLKKVEKIHDVKLNKLKELLSDYKDDNFLIAYNYQFERDSIKEFIGSDCVVFDGSDDMLKLWNQGKIKYLLLHPMSCGHGLNLQHGGSNMVWYSLTLNLETYQQLNKRLHRRGQEKEVNIYLLMLTDLETRMLTRLEEKEEVQEDLLTSLYLD